MAYNDKYNFNYPKATDYYNVENFNDNFSKVADELDNVNTEIDAAKITIDDDFDSDSTNPVQNKVIDAKFGNIMSDISTVESELGNYLPLTGGELTGDLTIGDVTISTESRLLLGDSTIYTDSNGCLLINGEETVRFTNPVTFNSATFNSETEFNDTLNANNSISTTTLTATRDSTFKADLDIDGTLDVGQDINVTGDLFLSREPTEDNHATTKKYVDKIADFVGYSDEDIYGVEVDYENKKFTRLAGAENLTAGADFDALTPWGGRKRCNVTNAGNVVAYYGDTGYTETGALTVDIAEEESYDGMMYAKGTAVQVMVEQPIFYTKTVPVKSTDAASGKGKQGKIVRYYISPMPKTGFTVPRAFYDDNGIVQDKIYLAAYEGCLYDKSAEAYITDDSQVMAASEDMLSSIADVKPMSGTSQALTRANARTIANNRGTGWQLHNIFAMSVTQWLFMIEYAALEPQAKVGKGVCSLTDDGSTNMAINTGGTAGLGNGSGIDTDGTDGECCVSYRGEENLWGNILTWLDGINILAKGFNEVWIPKIGTVYVDDTTEGYDCLDFNAAHNSGFISAYGVDGNHSELFIPTEAGSNSSFADYVYQNYDYDGLTNVRFGGRWSDGVACGFYLYLNSKLSTSIRYIGCRLLYIPQTTTE